MTLPYPALAAEVRFLFPLNLLTRTTKRSPHGLAWACAKYHTPKLFERYGLQNVRNCRINAAGTSFGSFGDEVFGKVRLPEDLGTQDAEIQKMFEAGRR